MVSKVAVVALVAIIAVPIMMGYALNLEETTHTEYKPSKDPVNVTDLLANGDYYNTAYADIYKLNTSIVTNNGDYPVLPLYQSATSVSSSMPLETYVMNNYTGGGWSLNGYSQLYMLFDYGFYDGSITMEIQDNSYTVLESLNRVTYFYYVESSHTINYSYYNSNGERLSDTYINSDIDRFRFTFSGFSGVNGYWGALRSSTNTYVDFSSGFRLNRGQSVLDVPDITNSCILTINLDSMLGASTDYFSVTGQALFGLYKTTIDGEIKYYFLDNDGNRNYIYYDPNRTDNTYQLYINVVNLGLQGDGKYHFIEKREMRYVGSWPTYIGEAPYYMKYNCDSKEYAANIEVQGLKHLITATTSARTPILRLDSALCTGFLFKSIYNNTYDPAAFRNNPITTITDISLYGSTIIFGSNEYVVTDGNITIGSKEFSIRKSTFESVPITGGYSNRINGVEVSTSATPSTIYFGGQWLAQITTDSMVQSTYIHTDWTPGQFAWDGIDQNFLMIGLLAALGVFIGLGIIYRRTKAALGGLLIVCGGAILLFFTML